MTSDYEAARISSLAPSGILRLLFILRLTEPYLSLIAKGYCIDIYYDRSLTPNTLSSSWPILLLTVLSRSLFSRIFFM